MPINGDKMSDTLTKHMAIKGERYCKCVSVGIIDNSALEELMDIDIRLSINSSDTDCEEVPVHEPRVICPPDLVLQPDYPVHIGDPITDPEAVLHGFYIFSTGNPSNPSAIDLAADIAARPEHYTSTNWDPALTAIQINGDEICYHVIRLSNNVGPITIKDAGGVVVGAAFEIRNDAQYTYYVLLKVVAPNSPIDYELST